MFRLVKTVMFTFESIHTKKVGGLAEVPPRLASALIEIGVNAELYLPNHKYIDTCSDPDYAVWMEDNLYCIKRLEGVKPTHYLVGGGVLDDPVVYSPQSLVLKTLVFARVLREYFSERLRGFTDRLVFHGHDWHSIPTLLSLNSLLFDSGLSAPLILHFHLATKNRIELADLCRHAGLCENTVIQGDHGAREFKCYYDAGGGILERIAGYTIDKVLTVSRGFSKTIARYTGLHAVGKVDYVFNASPFNWDYVVEVVSSRGVKTPEDPLERARFRRTLLTNLIGGIEVSFLDEESKRKVSDILNHYSVVYNRVFSDDGPLVISTGRLSRQKGFDYVLRALDKLTLINPRIKLILSIIPLGYQNDLLKDWIEAVLSYPENLRVLPGVLSRENTVLLYYASNAVLIPSRSEPFGLVALESMASGTPVVAARTGGLVDIVVDIERDPSNGVGLLFDVGNVDELAEATGRLVELVEPKGGNVEGARRLRMNCIKRAGEFNWRASAEKTRSIYREFIDLT